MKDVENVPKKKAEKVQKTVLFFFQKYDRA